jgi:hypothetical protein
MSLKTIKQVRKDLEFWGLFWQEKQLGSGYASTSVTARICETLQTEVFISSDLHLFSHSADAMYVPPHIKIIDEAVSFLSKECRKAIMDKYIKCKNRTDYYLIEAENKLIGLL